LATNTDVLNRLITVLTSNDPTWDISVGTPEYKILEAVAQEIAIAANNNTLQNFSFDITTKFGADLDQFCALFGIYRNYGKRASGTATFSTSTAGTGSGTLTVSGATSGTYNVSYLGNTASINYNATPATIQSTISSILPSGTTCTISPSTGPSPYSITFLPALPPSSISFNFSALLPQNSTLNVAWVPNGGATSSYEIGVNTQIYAPSSATGTVPIYFQTTAPAQLSSGTSSVQVPIQAVLTGSDGNLGAGTISSFSTALVGITQVTNSTMTGGTDPETDAQLQQRWQNTVFKNLAGTEDQFLALAYNNQDTTRAKILGPQEINSEQLQILTNFNVSPVTSLSKSAANNNGYPFNSNQLGDGVSSASFNFDFTVTVNATWTASSGGQVVITIPSVYASNAAGIYQGMVVSTNGSPWSGWIVGSTVINSDGSSTVTLTLDSNTFPNPLPISISAQSLSSPITFQFPLPNLQPWWVTSGTATNSSGTSLTDSTANWTTNYFKGAIIVAGTSTGIIASNSSTVITLTSLGWAPSSPLPSATASYTIYPQYQITPVQGIPTPAATVSSANTTATITNVSGTGTTVTYTAANTFSINQIVTITGCTPTAYNLTNVTIASASSTQFTVSNSAVGTYVSGGSATVVGQALVPYANGTLTLTSSVVGDGLPPTATMASGAVRIFSGNTIYSIGYTGISGNVLTGVTSSGSVLSLANDLIFTSSYSSATSMSTIQTDLTNIYNNSPVNQIEQIISVNATYNSGNLATDANQGYYSFYQAGSVYNGGYAVNTASTAPNVNIAAYGAYAQVSGTTGNVNSTSILGSTSVTIPLSNTVPLATISTVGYPAATLTPSPTAPGILWYYQTSTGQYFNVSYTGTTNSSGNISAFTGCTLTSAFGQQSFTMSTNDKIYLPNIQQALNLLFGTSQGWETSVLPLTAAQGSTSTSYMINAYVKNGLTTTPMVPVNFSTFNSALVIQNVNLSSSSSSGVAATWSASTKVADLINAQILLSSPSPANLTFNYTGSTSAYPVSNPYSFTNTISPIVPDPQYFYPQGLELVQSNYNSTAQQSTASANVDYSYIVTPALAIGKTASLAINIVNGNNYSWLYPGNILDLTYYYVALASRNNPTAYQSNSGTISTNYVDVFIDGINSTQITENTTLTPNGSAITPGASGLITSSNQTNWVLGDGVSYPSVGDVYYIFSQQPVIQPFTSLYPNFISLQQGPTFTPLYPYGGPINSSFSGGDPTYSFTTNAGRYTITPLSRISAIYYNMALNLPEAFPLTTVVGSYQTANRSIALANGSGGNQTATTTGSYVNVVFNSDFYPIYDNTENAGSPQSITGIAIRQPYYRWDSGASFTNGSTIVMDSSAQLSDIGATIINSGNFPLNTRIQNVNPGVSFTISQAAIATGSGAEIVRYANTPSLSAPISTISSSSTTMTVNSYNNYKVGQQVIISGNTNSTYNKVWTIASVNNADISGNSPYNSNFTVTGTGLSTSGGSGGFVSSLGSQLNNIQYYINSDVSAVSTSVQQQRLVGVNTMTHQASFQQIMVNLAVIIGNGANPSTVYSSLQSTINAYLNSLSYLQPIRTSAVIKAALSVSGVLDARLANTTDSKTYYGIQIINPYAYYDAINDIAVGSATNVDYRDIIVQSTSTSDIILNSNQLPQLFRVNVYFRSQNDF